MLAFELCILSPVFLDFCKHFCTSFQLCFFLKGFKIPAESAHFDKGSQKYFAVIRNAIDAFFKSFFLFYDTMKEKGAAYLPRKRGNTYAV